MTKIPRVAIVASAALAPLVAPLGLSSAGAAKSHAKAAAAAYTGPSYPGSTLTLSVQGKSIAGRPTIVVATGDNPNPETPDDYRLDAYAKRQSIDPTCADTSFQEGTAWTQEPTESKVAFGVAEGPHGQFTTTFKVFLNPGVNVICGYSLWSYDTAANTTLVVHTVTKSTQNKPVCKRRKRCRHRHAR